MCVFNVHCFVCSISVSCEVIDRLSIDCDVLVVQVKGMGMDSPEY